MSGETGRVPSGHPVVSVALATFDGMRFLEELLVSIESQDYPAIEIVVSDDGSTDGTRSWLETRTWARPHRLLPPVGRAGVVGNFARALEACGGDYVALADQDDWWDPGKVSALVEACRSLEGDDREAALAFCDIEVVDEALRPIAASYFAFDRKSTACRRLDDFLVANHVPGCAMLVNRALLARALPVPTGFFMHDWWLTMTASAFGRIAFVDRPLVRYRQHGANVLGAKAQGSSLVEKILKAWRPSAWARYLLPSDERADLVARNVAIFVERYGGRLPPAALATLAGFDRATTTFIDAVRFAFVAKTGERRAYTIALLRLIGRRGARRTHDVPDRKPPSTPPARARDHAL